MEVVPRQGRCASNDFGNMLRIEDATCLAFTAEQEQIRSHFGSSDTVLSPCYSWRERVTQWCYDVIDHLGEDRELAYVAMNILDRYTGCRQKNERAYEIEAMAALFLAIRVGGSKNISLQQFVSMSRDGVSENEISAVGKTMISSLSWNHQLLTPADFVRSYVNAMTPLAGEDEMIKSTLLESALYMVELAVFDFFLARKRPSLVAAAATLSAIHKLSVSMETKQTLVQSVTTATTRFRDLASLHHRLDRIFNEVPDNENNPQRPHLIVDDEVIVGNCFQCTDSQKLHLVSETDLSSVPMEE